MSEYSCTKCESSDTFFSAISMKWKCESCGNEFEKKGGDRKMAKQKTEGEVKEPKEPKVRKVSEAKQAEIDAEVGAVLPSKHTVTAVEKLESGELYHIHKTPSGKKFEVVQTLPKGKMIEAFAEEEAAKAKLAEVVAEATAAKATS